MKKLFTFLVVLFIFLSFLWGGSTYAEVTGYTFSQTTGTYTAITGGTVLGNGTFDDNVYNANNIGFPFVYNGSVFTQFSVNANGWLCMGSTAVSSYLPISGGTSNNVISALGVDLNNDNSGLATLRYELIGSAPNRTLVVQWARVGKYVSGGGTENYNFQIRLNETTNTVEIVYGSFTVNATSTTVQVGLRGASTTYFNNRLTTTNWAATTAGTLNTDACMLVSTGNVFPSSGLTFKYSPPAVATPADPITMTFTGVTGNTITVNWVDNSTTETGFFMIRASDAGFTTGVNYYTISSTTTAGTGTGYNSGSITGLIPGTTYYFIVYAYNDNSLSTPGLSGNKATNPPGNITATGSGNWSSTTADAPWPLGVVPTATDNVTIPSGITVTVDAATNTCYNLTIDNGGTVNHTATATANVLTVNADLTNNGTLDLYASATSYCTLAFQGAYNSTFTGSGATTDLGVLMINKGSGTITPTSPVLDIKPTNLTIKGSADNNTAAGAFLASATWNGIVKFSGTYTLKNTFFQTTGYSIPATGGFWLSNPNITVYGLGGSPTQSGYLRVTNGTYNVGTSAGNSMSSGAGSYYIFEGGALNVAGRLYLSSTGVYYNQSGGNVTVQTVGNTSTSSAGFYISSSAGNTFIMSGGNIIIQLANTATTPYMDYYNFAPNRTFTGGNLQFGSSTSGAAKTYRMYGYAPNVIIDGTAANTVKVYYNTGTTGSVYAVILGNLTINSTTTYATNTWATIIAGSVVNNGAIVGTTSYDRFDFQGSAVQTYSGTGTFGTAAAPFTGVGVGIANTAGVTLSSPIYTTRVNLFGGTFTNSNQFNLGIGGTSSVYIQRGGMTGQPAGSFDVSPTFNIGSGGITVNYYTATTATTTGPEVPASRVLNNMIVNNAPGVVLSGGSLSTAALTMTLGNITTSAAKAVNILTVTGTAATALTYTAGYVNGPFARTLPASLATGSTYLFPIGKSAYKAFELVNPTTNGGGTVVVQAEVYDANCGGTPGLNMSALNTDRYWNATMTSGAANFTNSTVRLTETGLTGNNGIGKSSTVAGTYDLVSSAAPVGNTLLSDVVSSLDYFAIGTKSVPMVYTSSAVTQASTATVLQNSVNQAVIGIQIVMTGNASPLDVTKFTVSGNGTTAVSDISNAKIWYTGTSSVFATGDQFGTVYASPTLASFDITGSKTLAPGTNYFWLTFDIPLNAVATHVVDGECTGITVAGSDYTPTGNPPTGTRTITLDPPATFTALAVSGTEIDLTWTKNTVGQNIMVATNSTSTFGTPANGTPYAANDLLPTAGTVIYNGPLSGFNHTLLTPNTTYYYKAWSVDANNYYSATGLTANAKTPCDANTTYPWSEGFEGMATVGSQILPDCWSFQLVAGSSGPYSASASGTYYGPHNGTHFIYTYYAATTWVFTPKMHLTGGVTYEFSFWMMNKVVTSPVDFLMDVAYGSVNNNAGMTNVLASGIVCNNSAYQQFVYTFTPASDVDYFFGVKTTSATTTPWYISLDDFSLQKALPVVTTTLATNITGNSASSGGDVVSGSNVTERGVCYGLAANPTISGTHTSNGGGLGTFISGLTPLTPSTLYYYRAFATNSYGTAYGDEHSFTTLNVFAPTVTMGAITDITNVTATAAGTVDNDGGSPPILENGFVYSLNPAPIIGGAGVTKVSVASPGVGAYTYPLTGLASGTRYYINAYATNSVGNAYGTETSFVTNSAPTVTTTVASAITSTTATSGGQVTIDGGATVTARGVCYGLAANPDLTGTYTSDGTGTGVFTSSLGTSPNPPLTPATTYHYRAYATNIYGTAFGSDLTFTTACAAVTPPWTQNFDGVTAPAIPTCMAVTNDNGDGYAWQTNTGYPRSTPNAMYIAYNSSAAMNDWFYSAPLDLAAGQYKVSFWYKCYSASYPESMEVKWGTAQNAASMTNGPIYTNSSIANTTYAEGTGIFTVVTPGVYYIGWHGNSLADMWNLYVDDISVTSYGVGTLKGYVTDCSSGDPILGATVTCASLTDVTDAFGYYEIPNVPIGTQSATASATGWTSSTINGIVITAGGTTNQDFCMNINLDPPVLLQAAVQNQYDVHLTWSVPGTIVTPDQWIKWDDGTMYGRLGNTATVTITCGSRWPVADLTPYLGMYLKKIEFYDAAPTSEQTYVTSTTVKVWKGANAATQLYSYTVPTASIIGDAYNTVTFPGILIDGSDEIWFGVEYVITISGTGAAYPAGWDATLEAPGKGNMLKINAGSWIQTTDYSATWTHDWNIHGWVAASPLAPDMPMSPMPAVNSENGQLAASFNTLNTPMPLKIKSESLSDYVDINGSMPDLNSPVLIGNSGVVNNAPLAPAWTVLGYNVYRDDVKINTSLVVPTSYDDPGLTPGTYSYKVTAVYAEGESAPAGPVSVTIYSCGVPTVLPVTGITSTNATFSWTPAAGTASTNWIVEYGPAGFAHGSGTSVPVSGSPTLTVTTLYPGVTYDVYVRTDCGSDLSPWAGPVSFATTYACPTGGVAELEPCGTDANGGCNMTTPAWEPVACGETKCGTAYADGSTRDTDWYTFTLTEPTNVTVSGTAQFNFQMLLIDGRQGCASTTIMGANSGNAAQYRTISMALGAGTYYVWFGPITYAMTVTCGTNDAYWFHLDCNTNCVQPLDLGVNNLFPTSADLVWTCSAALKNIEWGPGEFEQGSGANLVTDWSDNFYPISTSAGTKYSFYVQAACGSPWSGPYIFTTPLCEPANQCSYTVEMTDAYGDGWNGNVLGFEQDGVIVATFGEGFTTGLTYGPVTVGLCNLLSTNVVVVTLGTWTDEVGFVIKDQDGVVVCSRVSGSTFTASTIFCNFTPNCTPPTKTLTVTAFIQALTNSGTGTMNEAQGDAGPQWGSGIADHVTLELHDATAPYDIALAYPAFTGLDLSTSGVLNITTIPGAEAGDYYIVIKHRNSIETWSGAPVSLAGAGPILYDFSAAATQAYGSNEILIGTVYAIYSGDVNQDGIVDGADMSAVFNTSQPPALTGYNPEDVNGDGIVDGADMSVIFNNSQPPPIQLQRP